MDQQKVNTPRRLTLNILFGVLSFLLALYIFGAITHDIFHHKQQYLDDSIFNFLSRISSPVLIRWMRIFSVFGKPEFLIPAYLIIIGALLIKKRKGMAVEIGIVAATSTALSFGLKFIFQRERPKLQLLDYLGGYSFPSGHALLGFVFCSVIIYLLWQSKLPKKVKITAGILMFIFSLMVGISRIVLRVHYPSDVIAGFAVGYAWVLLFMWFVHRKRSRHLAHRVQRSSE
jgi:undecaprenyl-diphosphatase